MFLLYSASFDTLNSKSKADPRSINVFFFISNFHSGFFNPYAQALLGSPMAQFQASPATAATVNMNHPLLGQMQVCTYL